MALTQVSTKGIKDATILNADINASAAIAVSKLANFVTSNADNRLITGSGTVNTLNGESSLTYGGTELHISNNSPSVKLTDTDNSGIVDINNVGGAAVYQSTGDTLFETNGSERVRIAATGKVGIGTTSPGELLSLKNTSAQVNMSLQAATNGSCAIFFGDTDTVVRSVIKHHNNDDALAFFTGGNNERMRIDSSGHVGIGTTSPSYRLSVEAASGTDVTALFKSDDANAWIQIRDNTTTDTGVMVGANGDNLLLRAGSNTRMYLKSDGNVGIGTTSPSSKLQVEGNVQFGDGGGFDMNINGTRHQFSLGGSEKMRIDSSGNVGINETSPETTLHVENDNAHSSTFYLNSDATILAANKNSSGTRKSVLKLESDAAIVYGGPGGTLIFSDRQDERMRIDSSGHLLIGMTSASTTTQGMMFRPGQESSIFRNSGFNLLVGGAQSGQRLIDFRHNGASIGHISKSGTTGISYNEGSDYRLKENAVAISDGITRLKTLKPYRFNFKADASTTVDGFFAHELTAVPEAISGTKDEVDENNEPVYQGIDKSKLVPLLVAALQEAIGRIEVLEAK